MCSQGAFEIPVLVDRSVFRHRSGVVVGERKAIFKVDAAGLVQWTSLSAMEDTCPLAKAWCRALLSRWGQMRPHFVDFFVWMVLQAFERAQRRVLPIQFLWMCGEMFEKFIIAAVQDETDVVKDSSGVSIEEAKPAEVAVVALYAQALGEQAKLDGCQFLSGAVDKSRVHQHGCWNGCYARTDNVAMWAAPLDL